MLCFDKDLENRDTFDFLSKFELSEIMENKNVEKVVLQMWSSQYNTQGTIFECSSAYHMVFDSKVSSIMDEERKYRFYNARDIKQFRPHMF